ncbi:MAG: D-alanyl-D-alanine carboxypeptidase/D-alanyl-D-alanine-endopeptidase [Bacteroidales bacterium]|nr:D-alanyl-D-alanine carboxypeptidase/D-alanyl-D-alanine-endopeptidase [Bacteroidales bacterium]
MKKLFLAVTFIAALFSLQAQQTAELDRMVNQIRRETGMKHGTLAVTVQNATTGKIIYSQNGETSMTPASVAKLFTTGVGFSRLGRDFRFTTKIAVRGDIDRDGVLHGNIYIFGGGDPLLGSYRYRQTSPDSLFAGWMRALRRKGIRRVDGRVCYNTTIFDEQPLHDSWQWGDVGNYYGAGACGLNFHENMYFVHFNAGKKIGYPATVARIVPKNIDIHGICEVTTASENSGDQVVIYGSPTSKERIYRGTVPLGKSDFAVRGAMPNPARNCADLFSLYLRTHGIGVASTAMQVYSTPDSLRQTLDYYSTSYYTIAQYTNLTSNNVYAESIFKYLGYAKYGIGSFANGSRAVTEWMKEKGLDIDGVNVVDGSGLSRLNRTTTEFLCNYLTAVSKEAFFDDFLQSIAKVGESGTAKNLLPNLPAGITMRVKTGTMDGVKSYAGYVITPNGQTLTFAIVSNGHDGSDRAVADKLNKILYKIATIY